MKPVRIALLTLVAAPLIAQAHTHLQSATPADGSTVASAPTAIKLMFSEPTRLTAVILQKEGDKSDQKLAPLPDDASKDLEVAAPKLGPGNYLVKWRAVGKDNHVMSGVLRFTVSSDGTSSAPKAAPTADEHSDAAPKTHSDVHARH